MYLRYPEWTVLVGMLGVVMNTPAGFHGDFPPYAKSD